MNWFVYILESEVEGDLYKGSSGNYIKRFREHNLGFFRFTSLKRPWKLRYVEVCSSKKEALIREKQLKRQNRIYLEWLFRQESNILNTSSS